MESFRATQECLQAIFRAMMSPWSEGFGLSSAFCPLYSITALLLVLLWLRLKDPRGVRAGLAFISLKAWQARRSVLTDGLWSLGYFGGLRVPVAALHVFCFERSYQALLAWGDHWEPFGDGWELPDLLEGFLATAITMLAFDLAAYLIHRAMHRWQWLWTIHRVHHSVTFLTPLSNFRQHPLEPLLLSAARGLAAGAALGGLHLLLPRATPVWMFGGLGVGFFLYMLTVHLHHAPVAVHYPRWVRAWFVSPHQHHIHHSADPRHFDKNFGVIFAFWDRWGGTACDEELAGRELTWGLGAYQEPAPPELCLP